MRCANAQVIPMVTAVWQTDSSAGRFGEGLDHFRRD
jgi:hypothetical protein